MVRYQLCVLLILCSCNLFAQDHLYNKVWIGGGYGGIDFSSGVPVPIAAQMEQKEGLASATGPDGRLLFYTDGYYVWNSRHELMSNGSHLAPYYNDQDPKPTYSTTQAAVIVPIPDSAKYYIFSLTQAGTGASLNPQLFYSVVNMDLNGCLGDVEPGRKGILLPENSLSEKMTAVRGDNCNIWLVVHEYDDPIFKSYEITSAGVNPVPVVSISGQIPGPADPDYRRGSYSYGVMKVSPDRTRLALINLTGRGRLELHKFDPSTGKVSGGELLNENSGYAVCFSPDNLKLYSTGSNVGVDQYDLTSSDPATIINSGTSIGTITVPSGDMQLAADNKIYIALRGAPLALGMINFPDLPGKSSKFEIKAFKHAGTGLQSGLPNAFPVLQAKDTVFSSEVIKVNGCFTGTATLNLTTGRDHLWEDNSTCRIRMVDKPGVYIARYLGASCIYHVDTFIVPDIPKPVYPEACGPLDNAAWFNTQPGDTTVWEYKWLNSVQDILRKHSGRTGDTLKNIPTGSYSVNLTSSSGCNKSFSFKTILKPYISMLPDKDTICLGEPILMVPEYTEPVNSWFWDFGDGTTSAFADPMKLFATPGSYKVLHSVVSTGGCKSDVTTQEIIVNKLPYVYAGTDITIIKGDALILKGETDGNLSSVHWVPSSFLSNDRILNPAAFPPGNQSYSLTVANEAGCSFTDTVQISVLSKIQPPNAFSPNQDGINDRWEIAGLSNYSGSKITVFSRWGQLVFRSYGYNIPWNGKMAGKDLPAGTYYYRIDLGNETALQGSVTLIR